jgi:protein-tyrosine phosphatase
MILPNVFLGSFECARNKAWLKARNVSHIVSVIEAFRPLYPEDFWYHHIPVIDIDSTELMPHFEPTHQFMDTAIDSGSAVLVHCAAGISRSATIVTSYVMKKQQMTAQQALAFVTGKRPIVCPNLGFRRQLEDYEKQLKKSRCLVS